MEFRAGDATELDLPRASADLVFSNWLLMYLSDAEVAKLAADALSWARPTPAPCCWVLSTAVCCIPLRRAAFPLGLEVLLGHGRVVKVVW